MVKNCDNCINSGRPSYEYPCTVCATAYGSAPSKWESNVSETADMVEVVRCKDCKYWVEEKELGMFCGCWGGMLTSCKQDDFCSYGERKDNDR